MGLKTEEVREIVERIASVIEENKEFLTELDSIIGDADHGINMTKGFRAVKDKLKSAQIKDIGDIFKIVGMALVANVGGASGPLYGTAFMKAGTAASGKQSIDIKDFCIILEAAVDGIKARGKAERGDKTMIDALEPALAEVKDGLEKDLLPVTVLERAKEAALKGVDYTKGIAARRGRASYLGDRSIGHQDPGATSSYLILNCIYESIKARETP